MPNSQSTDGFVTSTLIAITKISDYLVTVEDGLATAKQDGLAQINTALGNSPAAKTFTEITCARFDDDLSRAFRYSALILLYTTFESRSRLFQENYEAIYGSAPKRSNQRYGFVDNFRYALEKHSRPVIIKRPKIWGHLSDINIEGLI